MAARDDCRRWRIAGDAESVWDVFAGAGQPVSRVVIPAGSRVVAVGARSVYALFEDADGIERLERYSLDSP